MSLIGERARGLGFTLVWLGSLWASAEAPRTIVIDVAAEHQTIDNFGASDCWSFQKIGEWDLPQRERVTDLLFSVEKGIGLSGWRFNIGGGINTESIRHPWRTVETFEVGEGQYDWSRQAEERWFLRAARERGVKQFIAFVCSPPGRMTRNGLTNCSDGLGTTNLKPGYERQFARYLADVLKHFREEWGISFDYISPVNEPQWEWNSRNQEGNRASNEDIKAIVLALHDELQRQGLSTKICLVESGDLKSWYQENAKMRAKYGQTYGDYLKGLFDDELIRDKIAPIFFGHSYWSDDVDKKLVQDRVELQKHLLPYLSKGWRYWTTEYCVLGKSGRGRDLSMSTALHVARVIHYDLTLLRANGWQWWTAVSPEDYKDGLIYTDYKANPNSQSIIESKLFWAFGNFTRFIRPGAVRVELSGADDKKGLMGSAYLSSDRAGLIVVLVNVSEREEPVSFQVRGLDTAGRLVSFTPHITSDNPQNNLKPYAPFPVTSPYAVPPRSVVTLVGTISP